MARPIGDETAHKVTLHINNGYRYATLRPRVTNKATGKRMNKSIHLGTVTESLKFIPGKAYLCMPPAERKQLVDMSYLLRRTRRSKTTHSDC